jgi:hypothetical protein
MAAPVKGYNYCGWEKSCGGMFTDGPADSDWRPCVVHEVDLPRFGEIYTQTLRDLYAPAGLMEIHFADGTTTKV